MTGKVTSITQVRTTARRRERQRSVNARTATTILVVVAMLLVVGVTAIISASSAVAIVEVSDRFYFLKRQLVGIGVGLAAMAVTSSIPYQTYRRWALWLFWISIALLLAVLAVGEVVGGSRRWLDLGPVNFQPSEFSKFAVVVALAAVAERKGRLLEDSGHFMGPLVLLVGLTGLLVMLQPDLGTTVVIGVAAFGVLLCSQAPLRYVIGSGMLALAAGATLAVSADYRMERIEAFLNPWADALGSGYQLVQSYFALGNGGLFGVGLGASRARWFYLPNAHTDFIFAIIGEETGLVGGLTVMLLFTLLAVAGWTVVRRAPDGFGRMLAAGITAWLTAQAAINIGGVLGVLPITGITLPLVSFGGTSVGVTMAAIGVLLNVAQQGRTEG
ncbi:MAG: stage V sporulation protein E [Acidimicrobiia bacterium]|nr:MAG: stage V sporulation protein E [Acidimicrobiia bacterium]